MVMAMGEQRKFGRKSTCMRMAFRSGQNYFKSISNIQTSYQHVITLNQNVENIKIKFKLKKKIKRKFKAYT